ncbi:hypothetical protein MKW92_001181 [Papaver armeniacum]|nr:hypothetical protein MKW92_001181 [Papaver armeniacum]
MTGSVPHFFCFQPSSSSRHTIAKRVKRFIHQFGEIAEQRSKFHLNPYVTAADVQLGIRQQRKTSSYTDEPEVYGREEDIEYIVNLLMQNDAGGSRNDRRGRDVSVFAIVGMGGLGKTTLAQKAYHDQRITDHFAAKCWICVSEDFNPNFFIKTILKSLFRSRLQAKLSGKKFFVVLDDVWNEDPGRWDTLKTSLSCGKKGSFIVVTTRLPTVASIMATLPYYFPKILSEEDCWNLCVVKRKTIRSWKQLGGK